MSSKIVIVEDNPALADIYKTRLELLGYTCFIGYNGVTGLYFIQTEQPDLVLLDIMIPDIAGDQVLRTMRGTDWGKDIPVIVISNLNETEAPAGLRELGITDYIVKANMTNTMLDDMVARILAEKAPANKTGAPDAELTAPDAPVEPPRDDTNS